MTAQSLTIINQLFEMQHKINDLGHAAGFERNFNRLFSLFETDGFIIQNPTGEMYTDARTDCEASIVGTSSAKMKIIKTLKPVIYKKENGAVQLVQKAVVLVENN